MNEIAEYKVIVTRGKNLESIDKEIQKAIAEGWQPYGELHMPTLWWTAFTQVVVKYKQPKTPAAG